MSQLVSFEQAIGLIRANVKSLESPIKVELGDALGYALAEHLVADDANPRFDNSAVDGYCVGRLEDAMPGSKLEVVFTVFAGDRTSTAIKEGSAWRILTGAPVPQGCYGIVMQEDVEVAGTSIVLKERIPEGAHIRHAGDDFIAGTLLAHSGQVINPGTAGIAAFCGRQLIQVCAIPRVALVTTGDELVDPKFKPDGAEIRDTNSILLALQIKSQTMAMPTLCRVKDDRAVLLQTINELTHSHDVVIVVGGASVGDRDYMGSVISEIGNIHFHGAAIRPGKPILFAHVNNAVVFGLPGNPASAFVCFELFVRDALKFLAGWSESGAKWLRLPTSFEHRANGRDDFLRVQIENDQIVQANVQGSFGMVSLSNASGLARFPADSDVHVGTPCSVLLLS